MTTIHLDADQQGEDAPSSTRPTRDIAFIVKSVIAATERWPEITIGTQVVIAAPGYHDWTVASLWQGHPDKTAHLLPFCDSELRSLIGYEPWTDTLVIGMPKPLTTRAKV